MINVTIATPSESIFKGEAKKIIISTSTGEIAVLAGHEPLMTTVDAGQIIIEQIESVENENSRIIYSAYNGVVNIENNKGKTNVSVLLESSEDVKKIDEKSLEESVKRAKEANVEKMDEMGLELNSELMRDLNKIKLARRYAR